MAVSIACVSGQDGVGKTTTCSSLTGALAERGKRVLAVDMDPRSNLTARLGLNPHQLERTVTDLFVDSDLTPGAVIQETTWEHMSVLPAGPALSAVEQKMATEGTEMNRELQLRDALSRGQGLRGYDLVIYDTPPNFGFHTVSAMAACDLILIPVPMSGVGIKGMKDVLRAVHAVRQRLNPDLRVLGVVPTMVQRRRRLNPELLDGIRGVPGLRVFDSILNVTAKCPESALAGMPITASAPSSHAAAAYRQLAGEILAHV